MELRRVRGGRESALRVPRLRPLNRGEAERCARRRAYRPPVHLRWTDDDRVLALPSGRCVRGRALREPPPVGPAPEFGLYLTLREPPGTLWAAQWLLWPDFGLPVRPRRAREALIDVWQRAREQRVEIACRGGRGRTGTALACVAVLDGVPPAEAVAYVRRHYDHRAVETPWQRRYVALFAPP